MLETDRERSIEDRVGANGSAFLAAIQANQGAWLAAVGGGVRADTPVGHVLREPMLERIVSNNAERFDDTSWARLCLSGYIGFVDA